MLLSLSILEAHGSWLGRPASLAEGISDLSGVDRYRDRRQAAIETQPI